MNVLNNKSSGTFDGGTELSIRKEKLSIFAIGLLSQFGLGTDILTNDDILKINDSTLEEIIIIGINFFTSSNIGNLADINNIIESFNKYSTINQDNKCRVQIDYHVTTDHYVNAVIKASNEEIYRLETIVNNFKKV